MGKHLSTPNMMAYQYSKRVEILGDELYWKESGKKVHTWFGTSGEELVGLSGRCSWNQIPEVKRVIAYIKFGLAAFEHQIVKEIDNKADNHPDNIFLGPRTGHTKGLITKFCPECGLPHHFSPRQRKCEMCKAERKEKTDRKRRSRKRKKRKKREVQERYITCPFCGQDYKGLVTGWPCPSCKEIHGTDDIPGM